METHSLDTNLSINDLPKFNPWVSRILGFENWTQKIRSPEEITQEYDVEKWGKFLIKAQSKKEPPSLNEVDSWLIEEKTDHFCTIHEQFKLMQGRKFLDFYINQLANTLQPFLPASTLVELGSGYGSILLALAQLSQFRNLKIISGEYTQSGVSLSQLLAKNLQLDFEAAHCDFSQNPIYQNPIPENAIIYTSYATCCVPELPDSFLDSLIAYRPKVVIHFEPCFEHYQENTLIGHLRKKYVEINDYNKNLYTLICKFKNQGKIKLLNEQKCVFGINSLLPVSILVWEPCF
jgi:hypothetical protein